MIAIGCDHAGADMKNEIIAHLKSRGLEARDCGANGPDSADYPVYAEAVAREVVSGRAEGGILICGTGIGMSIAANKVHGARCACCWDVFSATLSKKHNNSNIISLGARSLGTGAALMIVDAWLDASFQGGRHADRVAMYGQIEKRSGEESV